jgi:tetratricopeptide (TPR) repeat protein
MGTMGSVYLGLGLPRDAKPILEKSLAIRQRVFGSDAPETGDGLLLLGEAEYGAGDYPSAERHLTEAVKIRTAHDGPAHPRLAQVLERLAAVQWRQGAFDSAAATGLRGVAIYRATEGHDSVLAGSLSRLSAIRLSTGRFADADTLLREALMLTRKVYGPEDRRVAQMLNNLGLVLTAERRFDEAGPFLREGLALHKKLLGNNHPLVASNTWALATLLHQQGRLTEAESLQREALAIQETRFGLEHTETRAAQVNLAWILTDQGRCRDAEPLLRRAIPSLQRIHPGGAWIIAFANSTLGECLAARGQFAEAEPLLVESYPAIKSTQGGAWALAALNRIIRFYERRGNAAKVAEYRKLLPAAGPAS